MAQRRRFDVRAFRDANDLSAQRVADHLGVHVRTVQRWDAGDATPSPMALKALQAMKATHEERRATPRDTPAASSSSSSSTAPRRPSLLPSVS